MKPFDERRIDPTPEELASLLAAATKKANGRTKQGRVEKDRSQWERFLRRHRKAPEGHRAFRGDRGGTTTARVDVAWWTDRLGRRHWRVLGRKFDFAWEFDERSHARFTGYPLWGVYPDRVFVRQAGEGCDLLTACACGASGTPEEVGWVGERCGPCHDRLEEGLPPLAGALPVVLDTPGDDVHRMAFFGRGHLVTGHYNGRVLAWDLGDGSCRQLVGRGGMVNALAVSPAGAVAASSANNVVRIGDLDGGRWRSIRVPAGDISGLAFSPRGDRLAVLGEKGPILLSLAAADGAPMRVLRREVSNWHFLPDGSGYVGVDIEQGVVRGDFQGRQEPLVRRGDFSEEAESWFDLSGFHDGDLGDDRRLTLSPDGRWLAIGGALAGTLDVYVCDLAKAAWRALAKKGWVGDVEAVRFTADGKLAVADDNGGVSLWDPATLEPSAALHIAALAGCFGDVAFSPGGELLAFADHVGKVTVWPWRRLLQGKGRP